MIEDFITDVCELLNISTPTISYNTSHFATKTTIAQCDVKNNIIFLDEADKPNPDYLFAIAHELRHLFQYQEDEKFYLSNYETSDNCVSVEAYNLQIAEVDANAFAGIIMIQYFRLKPQWNGLSGKIIEAINKRTTFLLTTEFALRI